MTDLSSGAASAPHAPRVFTLSDFDFSLPPELIAQHPAPERSASRLLDGRGQPLVDRIFLQLRDLLHSGVLLVFNDTRALISGSNIGYAEVENTLAGAEKLIRHTVSE